MKTAGIRAAFDTQTAPTDGFRTAPIGLLALSLLQLWHGCRAVSCGATGLPRTSGDVKAITFGAASYNRADRPSVATRWDDYSQSKFDFFLRQTCADEDVDEHLSQCLAAH